MMPRKFIGIEENGTIIHKGIRLRVDFPPRAVKKRDSLVNLTHAHDNVVAKFSCHALNSAHGTFYKL